MKKLLSQTTAFFLLLSVSLFAFSCSDDDEVTDAPLELLAFKIESNPLIQEQPVISENGDITFYVSPDATEEDIRKIQPTIITPPNCTVTPGSGIAVDFSQGPVEYTVKSNVTGEKKRYSVKCIRHKYRDALILGLSFEDDIIIGNEEIEVPDEGTDILLYVPYGTSIESLESLTPHFVLSQGATIDPESGVAADFSGGSVEYKVTSENGEHTNTYNLIVETEHNNENLILEFGFDNADDFEISIEEIDHDGNKVVFFAPHYIASDDLTGLKVSIAVSSDATVSPANGEVVDFSGVPVPFVVTAQNGDAKTYYVKRKTDLSEDNEILSFGFEEAEDFNMELVKFEDNEIVFKVPNEVNLSELDALTVKVEISPAATVEPADGETVDFSSGSAEFTVTAEDGTPRVYTVKIERELSDGNELLTFGIDGISISNLDINNDENTVVFTVPFGTDISALKVNVTVSPDATVEPADGATVDFSSGPVDFTVTAADGSERVYTATCNVGANTAAELKTFQLSGAENDLITGTTPIAPEFKDNKYVVEFEVESGTDVTALHPVLDVSDGATVTLKSDDSPVDLNGSTAVDFSEEAGVVFVVKSASGDETTEYTVICKVAEEGIDLSSEAELLTINITGAVLLSGIEEVEPKGDIRVFRFWVDADANGNEISALTLNTTCSDNAVLSGSAGNFTANEHISYTITAEDGVTTSQFEVHCLQHRRLVYAFEPDEWELDKYWTPKFGWDTSNKGVSMIKTLYSSIYNGDYAVYLITSQESASDVPKGEGAAKVTTLNTNGRAYSNFLKPALPKITSGSLFLGSFETDINNTLESTKFGIPFSYAIGSDEGPKKPLKVRGVYKYIPGPDYYVCDNYSKNQYTVDNTQTDEFSLCAIMYEVSSFGSSANSERITGTNLNDLTNERVVAYVKWEDTGAQTTFREFEMDLTYIEGRNYDPNKLYRFAIVMSSSHKGDEFCGAPESTLIVDDIRVIYEDRPEFF